MRPASIWRPSMRPGSSDWMAYSPKLTLLPRVALPRMTPRCCLRHFTRDGIIAMIKLHSSGGQSADPKILLPTTGTTNRIRSSHGGGVCFRVRSQVDPHLDPDDPVRRGTVNLAIVDVRLQRVQRDRPVDHLLDAGDFRP